MVYYWYKISWWNNEHQEDIPGWDCHKSEIMEECAFALEDSNGDDNNPLSGELKSNLSFKNLSSVASLEVK